MERGVPQVDGEPWRDSSQARKLGLKPGLRIALVNCPDEWTSVRADAEGGAADVIIAFFTVAAEIPAALPELAKRIYPAGAIWAAWPRRAGGHRSDITDNVIRSHALAIGLVDVKVAAIDDDWSGLRLVWRVANRPR
jgi:hypothetical protein